MRNEKILNTQARVYEEALGKTGCNHQAKLKKKKISRAQTSTPRPSKIL